MTKTVCDFLGIKIAIISLLGTPVIALILAVFAAMIGLTWTKPKEEVLSCINHSLKQTGTILLITGAGGSLGQIIKDSGIGNALGEVVVNSALPAIMIPFIIAALLRIALGSATVSITTASSLTAPMLAALNLDPLFAALACCMDSIAFSYFNDSGFWVFNGLYGLTDLKDQVKCKTAVSLIMSGVGLVELLIVTALF